LRETGNPVVLTVNGKAEVVVQDGASYQKLLGYIDMMEALEGIKRGLADVAAGRVTPLEKFEKDFRKSMEYRAALADLAKADAAGLYQWVIERSPLHGPEWFDKLLECLSSLDHSPSRCPMAPEARRSHREIHNLLYGGGGTSTASSMKWMRNGARFGPCTFAVARGHHCVLGTSRDRAASLPVSSLPGIAFSAPS